MNISNPYHSSKIGFAKASRVREHGSGSRFGLAKSSPSRILALLLLVPLAFPAQAESVYLSCATVYRGGPPAVFSVTISEAGKVTHQNSNGSSFTVDGSFTPVEVEYSNVICTSGFCTTRRVVINRIDLSVIDTFSSPAQGALHSASVTSYGQCKLQDFRSRQF